MIDGGLRRLFREHLLGVDWWSIETGGTGRGIPDSNGCADGREFWIEYKQTTGWAVTLRPEQVAAILRRVRHGGRVWIAIRQHAPAGPRREARDALWLVHGSLAVQARAGGLRALAGSPGVEWWSGGPRGWNWPRVLALLLS